MNNTTNTRTINININTAKEWYNSGNEALKELALQAFNKNELNPFDFKKIKTFKDALLCLYKEDTYYYDTVINCIGELRITSKASAAMFMLNIVRKVLNTGYDLHLTKNATIFSEIYFPYFRFYNDEDYHKCKKNITNKYIGKFESEGKLYHIISNVTSHDGHGVGNYVSTYISTHNYNNICYANIDTGFLGCANYDIANHLGTYFGHLILEAMYGDMIDFKILD